MASDPISAGSLVKNHTSSIVVSSELRAVALLALRVSLLNFCLIQPTFENGLLHPAFNGNGMELVLDSDGVIAAERCPPIGWFWPTF